MKDPEPRIKSKNLDFRCCNDDREDKDVDDDVEDSFSDDPVGDTVEFNAFAAAASFLSVS